jgi:hypothetical protein
MLDNFKYANFRETNHYVTKIQFEGEPKAMQC